MIKRFLFKYFWITIIILIAFIVRLYGINNPIADWHSWRQADTAAVTRSFVENGFNPFYPRGVDLSGIAENPIPNLSGLRFVEFPIYNILTLPLDLIFGFSDFYSRLISVLFSLGSVIFIYLISKKYLGEFVGLLSGFVFAILPYNIYFSRTTLPEPTFVFFALGAIYFSDNWIRGDNKKFWWAVLFFIPAFLIKPWVIFFALPLLYQVIKFEGRLFPIKKKYLLFTALILLPFLLWRLWILQSPEGIPASNWLFNGDNIRFHPAFWWWIVSERLGREILGVTGLFLFFLGLIMKPKDDNYFLHFWALSMFLYLIVIATGNVRHDYYQFIIIPILCIFVARGVGLLITGVPNLVPRFWTIILALIFFPLTFYFTWTQVKELYKINNPVIVTAGKVADQVLSKDAIVLAPYNGDTAFLYQVNRPGFPVTSLPVPEMVADFGVTNYVSVNRDGLTNWVLRHFTVLVDNPNFVIVDLTKGHDLFDPNDPQP